MDFLLKKTIAQFLLPLPFGLIIMAIGLALLVLKRAKRTQMTCLIAGFLCIIFFSMRFNAFFLINGLQSEFKPLIQLPAQNATKIVVLGGGISGDKNYPSNITLNASSLSRLIEGIRIFHLLERHHKKPVLVLSGGRVFQSKSIAGVMRNTAVMLGIAPQYLRIENGSKDTNEEAIYLKKTIGNKPFVLVTSGYHMPRAMQLFKAQGMHPIAAPTQFFHQSGFSLKNFIPSTDGLVISDFAIHEYLGMLWAKLYLL